MQGAFRIAACERMRDHFLQLKGLQTLREIGRVLGGNMMDSFVSRHVAMSLMPIALISFIGSLHSSNAVAQTWPVAVRDPERLSQSASINCQKVSLAPRSSLVAKILCSGKDGASADWDLNAVLWANAGGNDDRQNKAFDQEQEDWRSSLNKECSIGKTSTAADATPAQRQCVITNFHDRAKVLRSRLSGLALAESEQSPERRARIQSVLQARGFFRGEIDGEFGSATREAIKRYQVASNAAPTGFLSESESADLQAVGTSPAPASNKTSAEIKPVPVVQQAAPDASESLKQCSDAIDDPLKPMIIDVFVAGGKHLGTRLMKVKSELNDAYGEFVTVNDDAILEKIDRSLGKVGCSVSYTANIKGLAGKVLENGATGRAQILIRQMSQQGSTIERRVKYTVQKTSGGSFVARFGLDDDTVRTRRVTQCVLAYGGICMLYR